MWGQASIAVGNREFSRFQEFGQTAARRSATKPPRAIQVQGGEDS